MLFVFHHRSGQVRPSGMEMFTMMFLMLCMSSYHIIEILSRIVALRGKSAQQLTLHAAWEIISLPSETSALQLL